MATYRLASQNVVAASPAPPARVSPVGDSDLWGDGGASIDRALARTRAS
jgi:hypothetical protein